jgi:hypothetical protein
MGKKNFDRVLNMDAGAVLQEVQAGNPGLAARLVSERVLDAPSEAPVPLQLVPAPVSKANDGESEEPSAREVRSEEATFAPQSANPKRDEVSVPASRRSPPKKESASAQSSGATIRGRRGIVTRASGREVARLFCYVEPELYREVRMYCVQHDVSISDLVNAVLVDALRRKIAKG